MRVEDFLRNSTAKFPAKTAVIAGADRLNFAEIDRASDRLAAALLSGGVTRGDRILVFMENSWEAVVAIFAVFKAGAVLSPVNPSTKAEKLAFMINNCRAAAIVTQARLTGVADEAAADAPSIVLKVAKNLPEDADPNGYTRFEDVLAVEEAPDLPSPGIDIDLAMVIYTSGSTGFPKGVMMTHQNIAAAAGSISTYLENTSDDIILSALPVSFDYGLYQVFMAALNGATLVLEKSFAFPYAVLQKLRAERVTGFPVVPTMAAMILQMKDLEPGSLPDLRYISSTAAALPPANITRLRMLFPDTRIHSMYGLTECKRCTYLPPSELDRRPGSVGIAIPGTEAYVVDDTGKRAAPGVTGELVIRGAHVMKGYWENSEATNKALRPGAYPWERVLHTGDLFRSDEDGFLYFVGRMDDIIKTRGEKVSPKEVENALYRMPEIGEAAVVAVPDPVIGMAIKAIVAPVPGQAVTEKQVLRHCARHLEDFMVPKTVEFRDTLPKSENGKIDRRYLEETLEAAE